MENVATLELLRTNLIVPVANVKADASKTYSLKNTINRGISLFLAQVASRPIAFLRVRRILFTVPSTKTVLRRANNGLRRRKFTADSELGRNFRELGTSPRVNIPETIKIEPDVVRSSFSGARCAYTEIRSQYAVVSVNEMIYTRISNFS